MYILRYTYTRGGRGRDQHREARQRLGRQGAVRLRDQRRQEGHAYTNLSLSIHIYIYI